MVWTKMLLKMSIVSALAGGLMLFGSATNARANDRDSRNQNVQRWEQKLDRDIDRHGVNSRQANHDRHELNEARESCQRRFGDDWHDHHDNDHDYDHR
jgi:type II secretory pathway component PulJ